MISSASILFISLLLIFGFIIKERCKPYWFSYYPLLVTVGFIASEVFVFFEFDTGIRANNFQWISKNIIVPILIFYTSYNLDLKVIKNNLSKIIILCFPVLIVFFTISSAIIYYGINHPTGFPLLAALIVTSILITTDPKIIFGGNKKIIHNISILKIESVFTGILSVLLYSQFTASKDLLNQSEVFEIIITFFKVISIGTVFGIVSLLLLKLFITLSKNKEHITIFTIILAYSIYIASNGFYQGTGVIALFIVAIYCANNLRNDRNQLTMSIWDMLHSSAVVSLFLLVGITTLSTMFPNRWLAIIIGIIAISVARTIAIHLSFLGFNFFARNKVSYKEQLILNFAGTRGTLSIALAFAIPTEFSYWWTIQAIIFGIILFNIFIQAPLFNILTRNK